MTTDTAGLQASRQTRPIIVCGAARSGTTFTGALLGTHPAIVITGEFFLYKSPATLAVFDELQQAYSHRWTTEEWARRRARLMREMWLSASREPAVVKSQTARRIANKTPGAEHYAAF